MPNKFNVSFTIGAVVFIIGASSPLFAGFSQNSLSVPALGMGGAFVAIADDASALFINPAGAAQLRQPEGACMYAVPYAGLPDVSICEGYVCAVIPCGENGSVVVGGNTVDTAGLLVEQEARAGYAHCLTPALLAGISAGYLYHSYNV